MYGCKEYDEWSHSLFGILLQKSAEKEFEAKLEQLKAKHAEELGDGNDFDNESKPEDKVTTKDEETDVVDPEEEARQKKIEKARRKREKQREKERQREKEIEEENANKTFEYLEAINKD